MARTTNPRKRMLVSVSAEIATFIVTETYADEAEVQHLLAEAIQKLDDAAALCVNADDQIASEREVQA